MDSADEEIQIFEEKCTKEEENSNHGDEDPSEPMQPVILHNRRKIPNWLKSTLLDA